jgi:3-deoxy-D-manno-octulosonic-acid transferase
VQAPCRVKTVRGSDLRGVHLLEAHDARFDPASGTADLSGTAALWQAGGPERVRVSLTALGRPVVLAAVTREGEEQALLQAWRARRSGVPRAAGGTGETSGTGALEVPPLLVIVPRHPQRFDDVAALVTAAGLRVARRSVWAAAPIDEPSAAALACDVWLGDTLGEMALYYALADAALLGGSFAPLGGQNLIEALACGCPIVVGPHTFNFAEATEGALAAGAAERVLDLPAAVALVQQWFDPEQVSAHAQRKAAGRNFAAAHRGAAQRMAAAVVEVWKGCTQG